MAAVFGNARARDKIEIRTLLKPISIKTIRNWQAARRWEPTWCDGSRTTTPDLTTLPLRHCALLTLSNRVAPVESDRASSNASWLHNGRGVPLYQPPGRARLSAPGAPAP
ncbi:hypothetical protein PDM28_03115 [Stenotrophomonas aracearum]|uniref:Uncharacterized protein n=1 Tax=Stenotrophomonas aracearum TaxID=3003272 RepID=A0ABY9YEU9_9GAMM|nr:hypothetical protein [Stenotrophomonas sp. A5588]WNH49341.1 hypothetical protein PDM28_03115 [Stenotrophomonas sp. A5588]